MLQTYPSLRRRFASPAVLLIHVTSHESTTPLSRPAGECKGPFTAGEEKREGPITPPRSMTKGKAFSALARPVVRSLHRLTAGVKHICPKFLKHLLRVLTEQCESITVIPLQVRQYLARPPH